MVLGKQVRHLDKCVTHDILHQQRQCWAGCFYGSLGDLQFTKQMVADTRPDIMKPHTVNIDGKPWTTTNQWGYSMSLLTGRAWQEKPKIHFYGGLLTFEEWRAYQQHRTGLNFTDGKIEVLSPYGEVVMTGRIGSDRPETKLVEGPCKLLNGLDHGLLPAATTVVDAPPQAEEVVASYEFDAFQGGPQQRVEVRGTEKGFDVVLCRPGFVTTHLFGSTIDQWGTWYDINDTIVVAQECGTRSFISALIAALSEFQKQSEGVPS